jgi:hypothetical protein
MADATGPGFDSPLLHQYMVFIVLMVSTSVCGSDSLSSNLNKHPQLDSENVLNAALDKLVKSLPFHGKDYEFEPRTLYSGYLN